jgi:hypothetical protein
LGQRAREGTRTKQGGRTRVRDANGTLTPKLSHERLEKQVSLNTIYQAIEERCLPHDPVSGDKRGRNGGR